jgi:hypothetical protein
MKVRSAAIRLTTSSGVNIDAIAITSICAIQKQQRRACARNIRRSSRTSFDKGLHPLRCGRQQQRSRAVHMQAAADNQG